MDLSDRKPARVDPVLAALAGLGLASLFLLPLCQFAPNRIVAGRDCYLLPASRTWALGLMLSWLALAAFAGLPPDLRARPAARWAWPLVPLPLLAAAAGAARIAWTLAGSDPVARVTLGPGFWMTLLGTLVAGISLPSRPLSRGIVWLAVLGLGAAGLAVGSFDALSLVREARNLGPAFGQEFVQHLRLTGAAVAAGTLLGLALGSLAHRYRPWRLGGFLTLNFLQTVPSLALFGLLIMPLAWLSAHHPALRDWGVKGIGAAPALIALSLYAALPIARNTLTALDELPEAALDAGRGMGMSRFQMAWQVKVPLAWPAVLAGIRVATVQTVGNTVVAALIGAGGLGTFIFQGLGQTAMDLVLLGTLPVVALALAADHILGLPARSRGVSA
jgi:osmoprotectant transport system permease protein